MSDVLDKLSDFAQEFAAWDRSVSGIAAQIASLSSSFSRLRGEVETLSSEFSNYQGLAEELRKERQGLAQTMKDSSEGLRELKGEVGKFLSMIQQFDTASSKITLAIANSGESAKNASMEISARSDDAVSRIQKLIGDISSVREDLGKAVSLSLDPLGEHVKRLESTSIDVQKELSATREANTQAASVSRRIIPVAVLLVGLGFLNSALALFLILHSR